MEKTIPTEYLVALSFWTSRVEGAGKDKKCVPVGRQLDPNDVLDWTETEMEVVIVVADGQKYRIQKKTSAPLPTPNVDDYAAGGILDRDIPPAVVGVTSSDIVWSDVQTVAIGKGKKR